MGERQEAHHQVRITQPEHTVMGTDSRIVHTVSQHYTLAEPCGSAGVQDVGQVILVKLGSTLVRLGLMAESPAKLKELVKVHAYAILLIFFDRAVKDYQSAHTMLNLQHTVRRIILVLLTHKDIAHLGITDHVFDLRLAAGGIEGDSDGTDGIGPEINIHTLGHILGKDRDILLNAHTQLQHGITDKTHLPGKCIPRDILPPVLGIIFILHGRPVPILEGLTVNKGR